MTVKCQELRSNSQGWPAVVVYIWSLFFVLSPHFCLSTAVVKWECTVRLSIVGDRSWVSRSSRSWACHNVVLGKSYCAASHQSVRRLDKTQSVIWTKSLRCTHHPRPPSTERLSPLSTGWRSPHHLWCLPSWSAHGTCLAPLELIWRGWVRHGTPGHSGSRSAGPRAGCPRGSCPSLRDLPTSSGDSGVTTWSAHGCVRATLGTTPGTGGSGASGRCSRYVRWSRCCSSCICPRGPQWTTAPTTPGARGSSRYGSG